MRAFHLVFNHLFVLIQGSYTPNPFDQMATASMIGGYAATIRPVPPASHIYLTTGKTPYVNFYHIIEVSILRWCSSLSKLWVVHVQSCIFAGVHSAHVVGRGSRSCQQTQVCSLLANLSRNVCTTLNLTNPLIHVQRCSFMFRSEVGSVSEIVKTRKLRRRGSGRRSSLLRRCQRGEC